MPKPRLEPTNPLDQNDYDAINSITAYYVNDLEQPDFVYVPYTTTLTRAMCYLHYLDPSKSASASPVNGPRDAEYMWKNIVAHGEGVTFGRKDVGALFRYNLGHHTSFVTVEYLIALPQRMTLNEAQLHEVEHLLNKADRTLGIALPPLPAPKDDEMREALFGLFMDEISERPKFFYQNFVDAMARKGTPVDVVNKDFQSFVTNLLKV